MNGKSILDKWLTEEDYLTLGSTVTAGYLACNDLIARSVIFSEFAIGVEHRPYLIRICVEHALNLLAMRDQAFRVEITPNMAHNCLHVRLYKGQFVLTSHFLGEKNFRHLSRPAINREILASLNCDLFEDQALSFQLSTTENLESPYWQILHGGSRIPEVLMLALPSADQKKLLATYSLPQAAPDRIKIE
jgi:hypothetical protein